MVGLTGTRITMVACLGRTDCWAVWELKQRETIWISVSQDKMDAGVERRISVKSDF